MIQNVVGVADDGRWGPGTVEGVRKWQAEQGLPADGKVGPATCAALMKVDEELDLSERVAAEPSEIKTVGAWTGQASLVRVEDDIDFCKANGINRLDVIVNDFCKQRAPIDCGTYNLPRIQRLCKAITDAGIELHLMSWIMPHATFIDQAAEQLLPLLEQTGASSLQWDAEEPWTLAEDPLPYEDAAERIARAFASRSCEMGVNGIGFTPADKFAPLAKVCDYVLPQCYATATNDARPDRIVSTCVRRWRRKFGRDKPFQIGLAAYRQDGIAGFTPREAMTASLDNVRALGLDTVVYWSLRQIQASSDVTSVIAEIRR